MKILKEVLSDSTLSTVQKYIHDNMGSFKWSSSEIQWNPGLRIGVVGSCLIQETTQELRDLIIPEIKPLVPECNDIAINYHLWQRGSGISGHTDKDYEWGATLYLNEEWHYNYGGLFCWQPKDEETMRAITPLKNTLVLNDDQEVHFVTTISPECPQYRVTLQIWGKK